MTEDLDREHACGLVRFFSRSARSRSGALTRRHYTCEWEGCHTGNMAGHCGDNHWACGFEGNVDVNDTAAEFELVRAIVAALAIAD
jgi:hypothetical protein